MTEISTGAQLTGWFENANLQKGTFYWEIMTNTVNFGYGINLSAAAQYPATKLIVNAILSGRPALPWVRRLPRH